ncbi:MAG: hypothetical protein QOF72_3013 [Blastocatellia bacterium]|jgi:hypothetical protein|nr:hypothetical protein [Blastocatellia bacterium]
MGCTTRIYAFLLLTFFLASSVASGQKSSSVHVRVLSGNSPVIGASVTLSGLGAGGDARGTYRQFTNEAGECEFTQLAGGTYLLRVSKLSFIPVYQAAVNETPIIIREGESKSLQSYLMRGGVVTGRLISTNNDVVTGVPVTALLDDGVNGRRYQTPSNIESNGTSISDDRGVFRIYGLRPGTYVIAVNAKRDASLRNDIRSIKYLNGSESSGGAGIFVGTAEEVKLPDIQLTINSETCVLTGKVKSSGNEPLSAVMISLRGIDDQAVSDETLTNAAGGFIFEGLAPGRYNITASSSQGVYRSVTKEITLTANQTRDLALSLSEVPLIKGRAYLTLNRKSESLSMLRIVLSAENATDDLALTSGFDGGFSLRTSRTGSFFWTLPAIARNQYLARITLGDRDITSAPLHLGDESVNDITIWVSTGAATIQGQFSPSAPNGCTEFMVYAVLLSPANTGLRWRRADICAGNSFSIYSLSPGRYYLIALPLGTETSRSAQLSDDTIKTVIANSILKPNDLFTLDSNQTVTRQPTIVHPSPRRE